MYFKRIDIQGFKSFAEPVSIEFHEGITCIVGPNGSGKSNISDAIRWVLGEQSPKMLRGGKMEEVIFAGTANRKSRGMAEVTLVVDNIDNILPIDYSEVAISRRMYRSGESEYSINKVPCRLRDIRELIMDTGIGIDGYSIIGQGKIADIVSNKPESRREIFEEAAGIVKYRTKKQESERKLEASKINLDRVNDIINEIESRIDGLKADSIKAKEFLELQEKLKNIEINIIIKNVESLELKNEYIKDDLTELSGQIENVSKEKESIERDIEDNKIRSQELEILSNETQDKLIDLVKQINDLSSKSNLREEKLSTIEKDQERLVSELASLTQKKDKEENNAEELRKVKEKIDQDLSMLQEDLEKKNKRMSYLTTEAAELSKQIENNKNSIYKLYNQITGKNSEIKSLKNLEDTLAKRKEQACSDKELSDEAEINLREEYEKALNKKELLQSCLEQKEKEISKAKDCYSLNIDKEKELIQESDKLKITMGQVSARQKMIQEMESAYEGYHHGVKFIMNSGFPGIHGIVAELIRVPSGYETAIETALGAAVQNIVCQDEKVAQEAINSLKRNKAGRLTFLPLSGIKFSQVYNDTNLSNGEGFQGFAVDCIQFDNKYRKVMEYLLGRVVIVDKLSNAVKLSKIAKGGLRFVTIEGEIINAGGAITGGAFRNKSIGLLERKAEAEKLEKRILELQKIQHNTNTDLENLTQQLVESKEVVENSEQEFRETEKALITCQSDINRLYALLSEAKGAKNRFEQELLNIDKETGSANSMIETLEHAVKEAEEQIRRAEGFVNKALDDYENKKAEIEKLSEEITQVRLLEGTSVGEKNNMDKLLVRIESDIHDLAYEIKKREDALQSIEIEKEFLLQSGEDISLELAEKESQKLETEETLNKTQQEKVLITRYLNEIQQKKDNTERILLNHQTDKHQLELKLMKNETQVESYKEKLWEDFEISYLQAMDFQKKEFVMSAAIKESREIKNRIKDLGEINIGAIKEYESVKERHEFLSNQREDLLKATDSLVQIIEDMDRTIKKSFKDSFNKIEVNFEKSFQALFGGGTANLYLEDESKPLETGIEIVVQPPGKKLQNINLMSGGEKTMTAIALMFAILRAKPTPFCILDEVEAALDEANIDRFAFYLKDFQEIQFTLITHQKATMAHANVLYGVTMAEQGISKIISLKLNDEIEL
ncbi:MAG: chromosome segregation protein SMC [Anaerovoracaceae bacterium]